ncbi:unnamed protein product [Penicillium bialowiezense]
MVLVCEAFDSSNKLHMHPCVLSVSHKARHFMDLPYFSSIKFSRQKPPPIFKTLSYPEEYADGNEQSPSKRSAKSAHTYEPDIGSSRPLEDLDIQLGAIPECGEDADIETLELISVDYSISPLWNGSLPLTLLPLPLSLVGKYDVNRISGNIILPNKGKGKRQQGEQL